MAAVRRISDILAEASSRAFVGRQAELGVLAPMVAAAAGPVAVAHVHGPGGIGKTCLLAALAERAAPGVGVLRIDCRDVEPTPRGLLGSVARAMGATGGEPSLAAVAAELAARGRTAFVLDTYEVFVLLDTWIRRTFLPALPATTTTVLSGRDRPAAAWRGAGWAALLVEVPLGPLPQADAVRMLRSRGLGELQAARANAFAHGHPLALELAAAALRQDPGLAMQHGAPPVVLTQLVDALLDGLPVDVVATLEAASVARRVTEPVLRALLDRDDVRDAYGGLRRLPFVERTGEGLLIHDVVRETVARDLAERDPERYARVRRRAWRHFSARAAHPRAPERLWQVTADLIYLVKNPVLRTACFPEGSAEHLVEPAAPGDHAVIRDIARTHETPEADALLEAWLDRQPGNFSVARGPAGEVAAFVHLAEAADADGGLVAADPVASVWAAHLDRTPPRPGDRVLMMRRWLGRDSGELLSPAVGVCWLDVKRSYMELRPRLSRLYSVVVDLPALAPVLLPLGFAPIGDPVDLGGRLHQAVWLDFGEGSVDGWLSRLVDAEIGVAEEAVARRWRAAPPPAVGGLSPRERQVLALVAEGLSNRAIAERLVISDKTAGRHVANIFAKLGVHNRAQATRIAVEAGLPVGTPG